MEHKAKKYQNSFSCRYNVDKLVYWESFQEIGDAILREKQLKGGSRQKKLDLITGLNPKWNDLYESIKDIMNPFYRDCLVIAKWHPGRSVSNVFSRR